MNPYAVDLWGRAQKALVAAERELTLDPDLAASRAYYAAFYAVSALFALEERTFTRHSAVESAVHRDLVKTGRWSVELGAAYSSLIQARETADYGGVEHLAPEDAHGAVDAAKQILTAIARLLPLAGDLPHPS